MWGVEGGALNKYNILPTESYCKLRNVWNSKSDWHVKWFRGRLLFVYVDLTANLMSWLGIIKKVEGEQASDAKSGGEYGDSDYYGAIEWWL